MPVLHRLSLALPICLAAVSGNAGEGAQGLLAAFRDICLVRPDSIWAIGALATARGFVPGTIGISTAEHTSAAEQYNLLNTWRRGEGEDKIDLTALTAGNPLKYQMLCQMDRADVAPDEIIAALKVVPGIGEPEQRKRANSKSVRFEWKIPADPRRDVLSLDYEPGRGAQRVTLSLEQDIDTPLPK